MTPREIAKQIRKLCEIAPKLALVIVEGSIPTASDEAEAHEAPALSAAILRHLPMLVDDGSDRMVRVADRARDAAQAMQALIAELGATRR